MYAIDAGQREMVALLLKRGASPARGDKHGTTPLELAASSADRDILVLLVRAGARR
jgi:ankyrin repeat protein